ncbi:COG2426 family protein [Clostridium formicaceticum]|uniref:Ligand-binding protein SH3 n=1 Tax=Clostridium formicaceticum TaxID=1497 RepID=A0AAC9WEP9_9CLOT|nr:small multi-drug export protein [Clostridium formicaceticum]AOY75548.1 ligand-binding protein SH3 [Clostridium formicaceticum]ARE85844.1 Putative small multi-drug export protein [Clostridium formicaceticum]
MGFFTKFLEFMTIELTVLLTAAMPIIELRGAIPVGISLGMSPLHAFAISFIGSILPVPIIIFGTRPIFKLLKQTRVFKGFIEKITKKTMLRSGKIQRYGFWGLILFVAIPLPGTGVWTGSLASVLLDMRIKLAFPAILIGNLIAGLAVMSLSHGVVRTLNLMQGMF